MSPIEIFEAGCVLACALVMIWAIGRRINEARKEKEDEEEY